MTKTFIGFRILLGAFMLTVALAGCKSAKSIEESAADRAEYISDAIDGIRMVETRYRFANGFFGYPETGEVLNAVSELGENTFRVTGTEPLISFTNLYTVFGGTLPETVGTGTWAYLYSDSGKVGFVLAIMDHYVEANFGKTYIKNTPNWSFVKTDDMGDNHNFWASLYK